MNEKNDHDGDSDKPLKSTEQDLIETVVPPARKAYSNIVLIEEVASPDEIPTERPPITEPVESGEQLVDGAEELPPAKKA